MKLDHDTLNAIAQSPTLKAVFAEMAATEVSRRAALVQRLQESAERHEQAISKARRDEASARDVVVKRAAAMSEAQAVFWEIHRKAQGIEQRYESDRDALTRELERSADPRIALFVDRCRELEQQVRQAPGNADLYAKIQAALVALSTARAQAEAMKLAALGPDEITTALRQLAADLGDPLAAADGLRAPDVDMGAVLAPLH